MLSSYKRITLKIGSSLLVDGKTGLKRQWLAAMAADIAKLRVSGADVSVVSSGAIALGRSVLGLGTRILRLEESQAAAAAGQILLARAWDEALSTHGIKTGQIGRYRRAPPLFKCPRHHRNIVETGRSADHQ
jgi:glutamate 5-kinase